MDRPRSVGQVPSWAEGRALMPPEQRDVSSVDGGGRSERVARQVIGTQGGWNGGGKETGEQRTGGPGKDSSRRQVPGARAGDRGGDGGGDKKGTSPAGTGDQPEDPIRAMEQRVDKASQDLKGQIGEAKKRLTDLAETAAGASVQQAKAAAERLRISARSECSVLLNVVAELRAQTSEAARADPQRSQQRLRFGLTQEKLTAELGEIEKRIVDFRDNRVQKFISRIHEEGETQAQFLRQKGMEYAKQLENSEAGVIASLRNEGGWNIARLKRGAVPLEQAQKSLSSAIEKSGETIENEHKRLRGILAMHAHKATDGISEIENGKIDGIEQYSTKCKGILAEIEARYGKA